MPRQAIAAAESRAAARPAPRLAEEGEGAGLLLGGRLCGHRLQRFLGVLLGVGLVVEGQLHGAVLSDHKGLAAGEEAKEVGLDPVGGARGGALVREQREGEAEAGGKRALRFGRVRGDAVDVGAQLLELGVGVAKGLGLAGAACAGGEGRGAELWAFLARHGNAETDSRGGVLRTGRCRLGVKEQDGGLLRGQAHGAAALRQEGQGRRGWLGLAPADDAGAASGQCVKRGVKLRQRCTAPVLGGVPKEVAATEHHPELRSLYPAAPHLVLEADFGRLLAYFNGIDRLGGAESLHHRRGLHC